jgi:predicted metal-dependent phosphoesterase TrpH
VSAPFPSLAGFIDLHSHTNASDGTFTPEELIARAQQVGLAALAITDHDTFEGYEKAAPIARAAGLDLVRGIELNSRLFFDGAGHPKFAHVLVYFPNHEPLRGFQDWIEEERAERRSRNGKLVNALQERGVDITLREVEDRGRTLAGRPHFARILVEKGYVANFDEAFRKYLGEEAPTYVERDSRTTEEVIAFARSAAGIPVLAHPIRLSLPRAAEAATLRQLKEAGLLGLEVYHSEHPPALQAYYRDLAAELQLLPTGGSDFHGAAKPDIELGSGRANNVRVPVEFLEGLRRFVEY